MKPFSFIFSQMYTVVPTLAEGDQTPSATWYPPVDIYERQDAIVLVAELPGIDQKRLHVDVEHGVLKIRGCREARVPKATIHVHQMEIPHGPFVRGVRLPEGVDAEHIKAQYEDGYLVIEIPRKADL